MVKIPVYFDLNGIHQIAIFEERDDGSFRRTTEQPMRLLRESIMGIGPAVGELVSTLNDREERQWHSPTVHFRHRYSSYFRFLREQLHQHRIFVFSRESISARVTRLNVHELQLIPTASRQVHSLLMKKLIEAVDLDLDRVSVETNEHNNHIA